MSERKTNVQKRSAHVKKVVAKAPRAADAVAKLSKKYFLSERTIWRDLVR